MQRHFLGHLDRDDHEAVVVAADDVAWAHLRPADADRCLQLDDFNAAGNDGAATALAGHGGRLHRDLAGVAALAVGDDADAAPLLYAHRILRAPEADVLGAADVGDDDAARLDQVIEAAALMAVLAEPDAVRIDDVVGRVELPHGLVGWHAAHGHRRAPEF